MLVCCLPTQNFQARLVGRKFFFLLPVQAKDTILRLNYLQIEAKNFFSEMTKKNYWVRVKWWVCQLTANQNIVKVGPIQDDKSLVLGTLSKGLRLKV